MGHDLHVSGKQDVRLVPLLLLLFFAMSAVGHYVFVIRDGNHAEPAASHGTEAPTAESSEKPPEKH